MPWPTPQDYQEAIQSPTICFSDPDLRAGRVEEDHLGLPRPISGGFAVVYKVQSGGRTWAVRCFQREVRDQQERYAAIGKHLKNASLPYTVGFEFLPNGICIRGQWYPILKMEWVQGQGLNNYIKDHLNNPETLVRLASSWTLMSQTLQQASIAHGDLQEGNVLVVGDELKLIDYDGMFVPALAGRISNESGHRNYQHPLRTASDYNQSLDNFSNWVIYISIVALATDPSLWSTLKAGDECLLFRKMDFTTNDSAALKIFSQHRDARLRSFADTFRSFLHLSPAQIPDLTTNITASSSSRRQTNSLLVKFGSGLGAEWLQDNLKIVPQLPSVGFPLIVHGKVPPVSTPTPAPAWFGTAIPTKAAPSRLQQNSAPQSGNRSHRTKSKITKGSSFVKVGRAFSIILAFFVISGACYFVPESLQHHHYQVTNFGPDYTQTDPPKMPPPVPVISSRASAISPMTVSSSPGWKRTLLKTIPWGSSHICLYGFREDGGTPAEALRFIDVVQITSREKVATWSSMADGSSIAVCNIMGAKTHQLMLSFYSTTLGRHSELSNDGYCEIWTQQNGLHQILSFNRTNRKIVCKDVDGKGIVLCYDDLDNFGVSLSTQIPILTIYRWNGVHFSNITRLQPKLTLQHGDEARNNYIKSGMLPFSSMGPRADSADAISFLGDYMAAGREKDAWHWLSFHADPSMVTYLRSIRTEIAKSVPDADANLDDWSDVSN